MEIASKIGILKLKMEAKTQAITQAKIQRFAELGRTGGLSLSDAKRVERKKAESEFPAYPHLSIV
jgi:hypothetical protein